MSDILKRPGWNHLIEEKAGRPYSKKLNSAISSLVDRNSLGSNPAQRIQRIANALHRHYADKSFSKPDIIEFIKTQVPSVRLADTIQKNEEEFYTADNQWNSRFVDSDESEQNTPIAPQFNSEVDMTTSEEDIPAEIAHEKVKLSPKAVDKLLKEQYFKRLHHRFKQEERYM